MGLATAYGPFRFAVFHSFVLREAEHGLSKESKIYQRIVRRDGGPVQGRHSAQPAAECRWKRPVKETEQPPKKNAVLFYLRVLFL